MAMKTITFSCETITPMFLSGADGSTPELRPPSIKGALRFWWRAMNGDKSNMREEEAKIFGGTDPAQRSKVMIRVLSNQPRKEDMEEFAPLEHKKGERGYFTKKGIKPSFKFKIKLSAPNIIELDKMKALFILVSVLGGLGNRSRRGFGAFMIIKIDEEPFQNPNTNTSILKYIKVINSEFDFDSDHEAKDYPYIKNVSIGKTPKLNATKSIGQASHDIMYKGNQKRDYQNFVGNPNRFASPVFVSVMQLEKNIYPIVTILNTANSKADNRFLINGIKLQNKLKNSIL